jgi:acyl transferase domain-containing protein
LTEFREAIEHNPAAQVRDFAYSLFKRGASTGTVGLSFVASSRAELSKKLETALAGLQDPDCRKIGGDIDFHIEDRVGDAQAKTALLFPGQGSQYPGMMREQALYLRELGQVLQQAGNQTSRCFPRRLNEYLFPRTDFADGEPQAAEQELAQTNIAQPAIAAVSCGYLAFLRRLGLKAGFVAGHSFGEYTALYAAGAISQEELLRLAILRGQLMANACGEKPGGMAAVKASREEVLKCLGDGQVRIANHNSPSQTVISGPSEALEEVIKALQTAKVAVKPLVVAGAFHTPLMGSANSELAKAILAADMGTPAATIFSNVGGGVYETDIADIRARLCRHLLEPVEFVTEVEAMYAAGVRIFVEAGPRSVLTSFVREILKDRTDVLTVALDANRGTLQGLLQSLGRLFIHGVDMDLAQLFENREGREIDLSRRAIQPNGKLKSPAQDWLINGGFVRRRDEGHGKTGKIAQLTSNPTDVSSSAPIEKPLMTSSNDKTSNVNESLTRRDGSEFRAEEQTGIEDPVLLVYSAYQETMREFLRLQGEVMRHFLCGDSSPAIPAPQLLQARLDHGPTLTPLPPSVKTPLPAAPLARVPSDTVASQPIAISPSSNGDAKNGDAKHAPLEPEILTANLLALVSERTGYPTEVLGLEQDMEADLGIDSIKRVEILGAFQNHLPPGIAARIQESTEDFMRLRTLKSWIDELLKVKPDSNSATECLTPQAG